MKPARSALVPLFLLALQVPLFLLALQGLLTPRVLAVELKQKTVEAFARYVGRVEQRMDEEIRSGNAYLWIDTMPVPRRQNLYAQLRNNKIVMQQLQVPEGAKALSIPDGWIHHWVGVIFIPGATAPQVLAVLQDYDHHWKIYAPDIRRSKLIHREGNDFQVYVQFFKRAIRTAVINAEFHVRYFPMDDSRVSSRSQGTRIAELENPGEPDEREYALGQGHGYLWRLNYYWRLEQKDGGVYAELEYIALSRPAPTGFGWLVQPIARRISRESLARLLHATRAAAAERSLGAAGAASGPRN